MPTQWIKSYLGTSLSPISSSPPRPYPLQVTERCRISYEGRDNHIKGTAYLPHTGMNGWDRTQRLYCFIYMRTDSRLQYSWNLYSWLQYSWNLYSWLQLSRNLYFHSVIDQLYLSTPFLDQLDLSGTIHDKGKKKKKGSNTKHYFKIGCHS